MMRYLPDAQRQRMQPPAGGPQRQHGYRNTAPAYQMKNYRARVLFQRFQIALVPLRPVKEMLPVTKSLRDRCPGIPDFPEAVQPTDRPDCHFVIHGVKGIPGFRNLPPPMLIERRLISRTDEFRGRMPHSTTTSPIIPWPSWTAQTYLYTPGLLKV